MLNGLVCQKGNRLLEDIDDMPSALFLKAKDDYSPMFPRRLCPDIGEIRIKRNNNAALFFAYSRNIEISGPF